MDSKNKYAGDLRKRAKDRLLDPYSVEDQFENLKVALEATANAGFFVFPKPWKLPKTIEAQLATKLREQGFTVIEDESKNIIQINF